MVERARITVKGIVQGVGFRPYVYTLARSLNLKGYVTNTSGGVNIDIEGEALSDFIERLSLDPPQLSRITEITVSSLSVSGFSDFRIIESRDEGRFTLVSPDVSICHDCLRELFDDNDRRYLYPFINCTNCGPRYTITKSVPYDRQNTTMSVFEMCDECKEEYHNPGDRRFHAQPNACAKCGPKVTLVDSRQSTVDSQNPINKAIELLKEGKVIAIKGLGGFHIACDATNEDAVRRLRERKRKSNKPLALMAPDREAVRTFCELSGEESALLASNSRPIVLLRKHMNNNLPEAVSPNNQYLGVMLPYTPLHHLLFFYPFSRHSPFVTRHFSALVMTSGNLSEEPIIADNSEVIEKLSGIVDAFLLHNRDIFMAVDDSVVKVLSRRSMGDSQEYRLPAADCRLPIVFIRRSRGYVPEPIALGSDGPEVLGCGADIKNTFTVTKGGFAIPSQHIGDMENYETLNFFERSLENMKAVYRADPVAIAHDMHPNYFSTKWARRQEERGRKQVRIFGIQHHYAHIASVMAEHGLSKKVIGVAFDGTGYGIDGNLWGGEFLVSDMDGFERAGHLNYIPLPGGEKAIKEPWRTAVSYILFAAKDKSIAFLKSLGFAERFGADIIEKISRIADIREFSPLSSGAGRLFDAVSAIIGLCNRNTFEGEAAMALESLVIGGIDGDYPVDIKTAGEKFVIDFSGTIIRIIEDLIHGLDKHEISTRFHNTVSNVISEAVRIIHDNSGLNDVILSGGTFQNLYLLKRTIKILRSEGMNVLMNGKVPCNDAGISLGQAYIVRERLKQERS